MILRSLYLNNFRRYEKAEFHFEPGVNLFYGSNAVGKTTILEAIGLLITGKSFRTSKLTHLIRAGESYFFIRAYFEKDGVEQTLGFGYDGKDKKVIHNNTPCATTSALFGIMHGVVLTPDDIEMIKGGPALRRRFLNLQIGQVNPAYVQHASQYQQAMQQRNCLLKAKQTASIEIWENQMAQSGAYLCQERQTLVDCLEKGASPTFSALSNQKENIALSYHSFYSGEANYRELLEQNRLKDMEMGFTRFGPHRDDLIIQVDTKEARHFASEGQQRSCVAALRFAEWDLLKKRSNLSPLLLLDDIGVSLDENRRHFLLGELDKAGQVILTSTEDMPAINGCRKSL